MDESDGSLPSMPAADRKLRMKMSQSFSSSSSSSLGLTQAVRVLSEYREVFCVCGSSHERVRARDPIGGDLSIKFDVNFCDDTCFPDPLGHYSQMKRHCSKFSSATAN